MNLKLMLKVGYIEGLCFCSLNCEVFIINFYFFGLE